MSQITMEEIRKKYPNPVSELDMNPSFCEYCVGGALCRYTEGEFSFRFPTIRILKNALMKVNKNLSEIMAHYFANQIISFNDGRDFEDAWNMLDKALKHRRKM